MPPPNKIKQIKRIFKNINTNLIGLEKFVAKPHKYDDDDDDEDHIQQLQMETTKLLQRLKQMPRGKIARVVKKRQKRRKKLRIQRKMEKQKKPKCKEKQPDEIALKQVNIDEETKPTKHIANHHNQLKKRADAERFVQTFELLENLHLARGWDAQATQQFASKITTLRRIWLNELRSVITEQAQHRSHETQWNKVIFGITINDYHPDKQKLKDFLRIRNTWDSYISQSKHATAIPSGWVLPPLEAMLSWQKYRIE